MEGILGALSVGSTGPGAKLAKSFHDFTDKEKAERQQAIAVGRQRFTKGSDKGGSQQQQPFRKGSDRDTQPSRSGSTSGYRCYNCGEKGHLSINCLAPEHGDRDRADIKNFRTVATSLTKNESKPSYLPSDVCWDELWDLRGERSWHT